MEKYIIYTDGGCISNPGGAGAYAAIVIDQDTGEFKEYTEGFASTTNNRMEIMAVIAALESVGPSEIELYSDSQYVINTMAGRFARKKNWDLWERLDKAAKGKEISLFWVKGHNGDEFNERCDALCTETMHSASRLGTDTGYTGGVPARQASDPAAKKGAMGVQINVPEALSGTVPQCKNAEEYAQKYKVNPSCAKQLIAFFRQSSWTHNFNSYLILKTGGQDSWSRKKPEAILEGNEQKEAILSLVSSYFPDETDVRVCLRWHARGLPLSDAIRKVYVDKEVAENALQSWNR